MRNAPRRCKEPVTNVGLDCLAREVHCRDRTAYSSAVQKEAEIVRLKAHPVEEPGAVSALREENAALTGGRYSTGGRNDECLRDRGKKMMGLW
ncbi:hypothetical protein HAX54_013925 [Datura stramonium]|uniref:Uncharacterized protein n=1 Tax=Datura stramonium TaxID=4076 RepID=A0ABS8RYI0_DATST|nr:hypothetical protein [Datura stramonium]